MLELSLRFAYIFKLFTYFLTHQKTKATETRVQEQSDLIAQLKAEIERMKKEANDSREVNSGLFADFITPN